MTNSQWQPIETAPKDGSKILIFCDGKVLMTSWYVHYSGGQPSRTREPEWEQSEMYGGFGGYMGPLRPTHWMPLPEPPGTNKNNSDGLLAALNAMTDEQRLEVFFNFCQQCGSKDSGCQCMNDE